MEKFNPSELQEGNYCTLKLMCLEYKETSPVVWSKKKNAMSDCPQITKEKRVKLESLMDSTQEQKSLKILEVDSISKEKVYPFWTESISKKSKKLLSCTMIDYEDLVLNSWNSSAKRLLAGLWFTVKLTEMNKHSPVNSL
jgi:hypothetical protein